MTTSDPVLICEWHPVARVADLSVGVIAVCLLETELVLWRSPQGLAAWRDRCPHRGARLSLGWVSQDNCLVRPYHGLAYDKNRTSAFRALENFLDVAHFPFIHSGWLGNRNRPQFEPYLVFGNENRIKTSEIYVWQPIPTGRGKKIELPIAFE
jgi:phenylpropionate dioxygenase-like ring-hydroxylating dioxygenase large terminal subunit